MSGSRSSPTATLIGYGALLMWSCYALMVTVLKSVPTFEILSVVFLGGFAVIACRLTKRGEWYKIKQPWLVWVVGIGGIVGNDFTNIAALKAAPPIQVELINYLWPMLVVVLTSLLPGERFTTKHFISGIVGLMGVYVLVTHNQGLAGFNWSYLQGYILALSGSLIWATYCIISRYHQKTPMEMLGMYFGVGAVLSLICHFSYEATVIPRLGQWGILLAMVVTTSGLAYYCWDYSCKKGNVKLLSILTYGNPVLSAILLIIFTSAQYSHYLAIAASLVVLASVISSVRWWFIWQKTLGKWYTHQPRPRQIIE